LRIIGVAEEDPLHHQTWSGSSAYFFSALKAAGQLAGTISAQPPPFITRIYQIRNFHPDLQKWRFRYHLDVGFYSQMTRAAKSRLNSVRDDSYDTILQIGALFDLSRRPGKRTVSYHDGNLASRLSSPYGFPSISQSILDSAFHHELELYKRLDHIFTMSKWIADSFVKDFGVKHDTLTPIGAGINLPQIREIVNKSYDHPHLLFIGKEFERKGGRYLLEAFGRVRQEIPRATLTVIGPELSDLPPGVTCLSYVSKHSLSGLNLLLDEYARASVFVMPSLYEPFGIVFAEAMAHKLPCIGTNICAMPELIDDKVTGLLVPPKDAKSLAEAMLTLLKNPDMCAQYGEAGYTKYLNLYTWSSVAERCVRKLEELA
jgi:glycosyltransferase involved in cell wall biosynthesis